MPTNLIGTSLDQVPVNGMLGELAFQNKESINFTGGSGALSKLDLNPIYKEITATAVDVFVYDTRKDSDGGAWRKRTQHTSWYNETLNTATRGSRQEFPSVAVIVITTSTLTIYDADEPSLPMWMVFNTTDGSMLRSGGLTSVSMLNAEMWIGHSSGSGLHIINFIKDFARWITASSSYGGIFKKGFILYRNDAGANYDNNIGGASSITIAGSSISDVTMVILPNAPIDSATGLPIPTIAVATEGGVSVIKDNGAVHNLTGGNWSGASNSVAFDKNGILYFSQMGYYWLSCDVKGLSQSYSNLVDGRDYYQVEVDTYPFKQVSAYNGNGWAGYLDPAVSANDDFHLAHYSNYTAPFDRIVRHHIDKTISGYQGNGQLMNYTSSKYNTGWMPGNIKGAWLSDTTQETVVSTELITNGTFNSDLSGWTFNDRDDNMIISYVSGRIRLVRNDSTGTQANPKQNISTIPGRAYVISYGATLNISGQNNSIILITDSVTGLIRDWRPVGSGTHFLEFVATGTQTQILLAVDNNSDNVEFDNISVRLADRDRSVNSRSLQVFGNITKTPVATGADLVGYSNWYFGERYLAQTLATPIGTSDFCCIQWIRPQSNDGSYDHYIAIGGQSASDGFTLKAYRGTAAYPYIYSGSGADQGTYSEVTGMQYQSWNMLVCGRRNGRFFVYINGQLTKTGTVNTYNISNTNLRIGDGFMSEVTTASIALTRLSLTFPSPEQIRKMYEDEKVLFQDNAKAVLYGTSDALTALAYDDDTRLLHAGTSSGRSVFQGLRRVDYTTTPVGAAISASNGMVVEE
jgi:trimeric autotransporter adhesin